MPSATSHFFSLGCTGFFFAAFFMVTMAEFIHKSNFGSPVVVVVVGLCKGKLFHFSTHTVATRTPYMDTYIQLYMYFFVYQVQQHKKLNRWPGFVSQLNIHIYFFKRSAFAFFFVIFIFLWARHLFRILL